MVKEEENKDEDNKEEENKAQDNKEGEIVGKEQEALNDSKDPYKGKYF